MNIKLKPGMIVECYNLKHLYINDNWLIGLDGYNYTTLNSEEVTRIWGVTENSVIWGELEGFCTDDNLTYEQGKPQTKEKPKMKNDFSNVKVGDCIFTVAEGWDKVTNVNLDAGDWAIRTENMSYDLRGHHMASNKHPSAWTYDPFEDTDPPLYFRPGEVIAVRDLKTDLWGYDVFKKYSRIKTYGYICEELCWNYARKLTDKERGE